MWFFVMAIGMSLGSFGNVLIDRLPRGETLLGNSRCEGCNRTLRSNELIPIVSWLFLRGKCRTCGARIPVRLPLVEAVSGILALAAVEAVSFLPHAIPLFLALWALLLILVIDLRTSTIPDSLTLTAFAAAAAFQWLHAGAVPVLAPVIGAGFFAAQWLVSRGRWVGSGDILLAAAIGMLVGTVQGAVWMLLIAYAFGANVAVILILSKRLARGSMIPFGPFLVIAGYLVLFLGETLPPLPGTY